MSQESSTNYSSPLVNVKFSLETTRNSDVELEQELSVDLNEREATELVYAMSFAFLMIQYIKTSRQGNRKEVSKIEHEEENRIDNETFTEEQKERLRLLIERKMSEFSLPQMSLDTDESQQDNFERVSPVLSEESVPRTSRRPSQIILGYDNDSRSGSPVVSEIERYVSASNSPVFSQHNSPWTSPVNSRPTSPINESPRPESPDQALMLFKRLKDSCEELTINSLRIKDKINMFLSQADRLKHTELRNRFFAHCSESLLKSLLKVPSPQEDDSALLLAMAENKLREFGIE